MLQQKVLSRQLEKAGCVVHVAGHGEEALDFLKTTTFWHTQTTIGQNLSIVLMDVEMPVMDGLTCVRRIREMQHSGEVVGHVPVLAVTANARNEQVKEAVNAGMDDTVAKPFRMSDLLPKIELLARRMQ
jgi:CheY-like chemotaxis protein